MEPRTTAPAAWTGLGPASTRGGPRTLSSPAVSWSSEGPSRPENATVVPPATRHDVGATTNTR